jgi:hypothetical protein
MLLEHKFDPVSHIYHVPNEFVISVSAIKELNGLSDVSQVPRAQLEFASHRGSAVHAAIEAYENDRDVLDTLREYDKAHDCEVMYAADSRMTGYYRFRDVHDVKLVGKMEETRVYRHAGTEQLVGGTIDMPCLIDDQFFVLDAKTSHKNCGMKAKQDMLAWKVQLQPYQEMLTEELKKTPHKAILHLHPDCDPDDPHKKRGEEPRGWKLHTILSDDSHMFDSFLRSAMTKLSHGYQLGDRK